MPGHSQGCTQNLCPVCRGVSGSFSRGVQMSSRPGWDVAGTFTKMSQCTTMFLHSPSWVVQCFNAKGRDYAGTVTLQPGYLGPGHSGGCTENLCPAYWDFSGLNARDVTLAKCTSPAKSPLVPGPPGPGLKLISA